MEHFFISKCIYISVYISVLAVLHQKLGQLVHEKIEQMLNLQGLSLKAGHFGMKNYGVKMCSSGQTTPEMDQKNAPPFNSDIICPVRWNLGPRKFEKLKMNFSKVSPKYTIFGTLNWNFSVIFL